jgi:rhodanese-related sulfurtransferase
MEQTQTLVNEICPTSTQAWVKRGAILVDVREQNEVEQLAFDVPAIVHIPLSEFEIRYKELAMDKELVIVCRSGSRSLRAAGFLINQGFDPVKVVNMKHGIIRWVQRGFPTKGNISGIVDTNAGGCCGHGENKGSGCC